MAEKWTLKEGPIGPLLTRLLPLYGLLLGEGDRVTPRVGHEIHYRIQVRGRGGGRTKGRYDRRGRRKRCTRGKRDRKEVYEEETEITGREKGRGVGGGGKVRDGGEVRDNECVGKQNV